MKKWLMMAWGTIMMISTATAQTVKENDEKIYDECEVMPEFPGGYQALSEFLQKQLNTLQKP